MTFTYIWFSFFVIAFLTAVIKLFFFGDTTVFPAIVKSGFDMSKTAFELSLNLTGIMALWLGFLKVAEKGGLVDKISEKIYPFFHYFFPEIPKGHKSLSSMMMNFSANFLGLDNAATPIGLKAMKELQEINPDKESASNSQIMFLVLNTSAITFIPTSIIAFRSSANAANPTDIFIPILISTFFSTLAGLIVTSVYQKINLLRKGILLPLIILLTVLSLLLTLLQGLSKSMIELISLQSANIILYSVIVFFLSFSLIKKVNIFEEFIEGAKEGFQIAIKIIPYLVAILVSIAFLRSSGAMTAVIDGLSFLFAFTGLDTEFVKSLPTAIMKPLSGSGARGMMLESFETYGVDSFPGRLSAVMQGATDTTFYILAVYFGSVGIKNTRHAITCGLTADITGIIAAIIISYIFFV